MHVFANNHSGMQPGDSVLDFLREPEEQPEHFLSLVDKGVHGLIRFSVLHHSCFHIKKKSLLKIVCVENKEMDDKNWLSTEKSSPARFFFRLFRGWDHVVPGLVNWQAKVGCGFMGCFMDPRSAKWTKVSFFWQFFSTMITIMDEIGRR